MTAMALDQHDLLRMRSSTHLSHLVGEEPGSGTVPGIAFAIVRNGDVVHSGGTRRDFADRAWAAPGSWWSGANHRTAFRIASMTKSFTAATLLSLRDDGLLDFDARVATLIPEFDRPGWNSEVTVRHLMTMSAGFPSDDPWGDRQQSLDVGRFRSFIADRLAPTWRPGECFEYSNLGYAMLGLVIRRRTGSCTAGRTRTCLDRSASSATGFDETELGGVPVAAGYARRVRRLGAGTDRLATVPSLPWGVAQHHH